MMLVIPEGAQIHITIGQPLLALPSQPMPQSATKSGRSAVMGLLAVGVVAVAFQAGRYLPSHPAAQLAEDARAQAAQPAIPTASPAAAADTTADFRARLTQPPQVAPPPGQAPPSAGAPAPANPFGLQG